MLSGSGSSQPRSSRGSSRGHVHGPSETLFKMKLTHRTEPKSAISTLILNEAIFANGKLKEVEYWTIRLVGPATVQGPDLENHREPSEHSKKRCFATGLLQRKLPQTSSNKGDISVLMTTAGFYPDKYMSPRLWACFNMRYSNVMLPNSQSSARLVLDLEIPTSASAWPCPLRSARRNALALSTTSCLGVVRGTGRREKVPRAHTAVSSRRADPSVLALSIFTPVNASANASADAVQARQSLVFNAYLLRLL